MSRRTTTACGPRRGRFRTIAARCGAVGALVVVIASCAPPPVPLDQVPLAVTEHQVADGLTGVSFAKAADVVGNGNEELVVSRFGSPTSDPGSVTIYERGADLDDWTAVPVVTPADGIKFPNDTAVEDLNGDGLTDLIVSGGFFSCSFFGPGCGSLQWFEQGPAGTFTRHDVITPDNERFYHRAIVTDVDGDGITDLLTVGETFTTARTEWYRGTAAAGAARFESEARVIGSGGGSLPVVADVDGDGDDDVVSPQYFEPGDGVVWFERTGDPSVADPAGTWSRHAAVGAEYGRGFEIALEADLFGDGVDRWIGTNHQNVHFDQTAESALWLYSPPADPTQPWSAVPLSEGIQAQSKGPTTLAPGLFGTGDLDGDSLSDIVVSGDGDARLFVMLQRSAGEFDTYVLAENMGQAGGAEVTDLDGDGNPEALFTSYEQGVVTLYEFGT